MIIYTKIPQWYVLHLYKKWYRAKKFDVLKTQTCVPQNFLGIFRGNSEEQYKPIEIHAYDILFPRINEISEEIPTDILVSVGISSEYFHLTGQTSRQIFRENWNWKYWGNYPSDPRFYKLETHLLPHFSLLPLRRSLSPSGVLHLLSRRSLRRILSILLQIM